MVSEKLRRSIRQRAMEEYEAQGFEVVDASSGGIEFFIKRTMPWGKAYPYPVHLLLIEGPVLYSRVRNAALALHPSTYLCAAAIDPSGSFELHFFQAAALRLRSKEGRDELSCVQRSEPELIEDEAAPAPGLLKTIAPADEFVRKCREDLEAQGYCCEPAEDGAFDLMVNRYGKGHRYYFAPLKIAVLDGEGAYDALRSAARDLPPECIIYGFSKRDGAWRTWMRPAHHFQ